MTCENGLDISDRIMNFTITNERPSPFVLEREDAIEPRISLVMTDLPLPMIDHVFRLTEGEVREIYQSTLFQDRYLITDTGNEAITEYMVDVCDVFSRHVRQELVNEFDAGDESTRGEVPHFHYSFPTDFVDKSPIVAMGRVGSRQEFYEEEILPRLDRIEKKLAYQILSINHTDLAMSLYQ